MSISAKRNEMLAGFLPKKVAVSRDGGETDRKPLAEQAWREQIGRAIDRALTLARLTKQEASYAMGYADQSALSRWIAATERPLFDKLFAVEPLRASLVVALSELAGEAVEISTTVTIRRRVA